MPRLYSDSARFHDKVPYDPSRHAPQPEITHYKGRPLEVDFDRINVYNKEHPQYIGMDVHTAAISAAVRGSKSGDGSPKRKPRLSLEFVHGLRGSLHVSFEEGTCASCCMIF